MSSSGVRQCNCILFMRCGDRTCNFIRWSEHRTHFVGKFIWKVTLHSLNVSSDSFLHFKHVIFVWLLFLNFQFFFPSFSRFRDNWVRPLLFIAAYWSPSSINAFNLARSILSWISLLDIRIAFSLSVIVFCRAGFALIFLWPKEFLSNNTYFKQIDALRFPGCVAQCF